MGRDKVAYGEHERTWLSSSECVVTWSFTHDDGSDGQHIDAYVWCEYEPADPSVGFMSAGCLCDGEVPRALLDSIAQDYLERLSDAEPDYGDEDYDWEARDFSRYDNEDY